MKNQGWFFWFFFLFSTFPLNLQSHRKLIVHGKRFWRSPAPDFCSTYRKVLHFFSRAHIQKWYSPQWQLYGGATGASCTWDKTQQGVQVLLGSMAEAAPIHPLVGQEVFWEPERLWAASPAFRRHLEGRKKVPSFFCKTWSTFLRHSKRNTSGCYQSGQVQKVGGGIYRGSPEAAEDPGPPLFL